MREKRADFLTPDQQLTYWHRWRDGDKSAGEKIYLSYEKFIHKTARDFGRKLNIPEENLFSSARAGFFEAMNRFDPSHETTIGTYSVLWMKVFMRNEASYLLNAPTRSSPAKKVAREVNKLIGLNPVFNLPLNEIYKQAAENLGMDAVRVKQLYERASRRTVSLTIPNYDGEGETIADNIADENVTDPLQAMQSESVKAILQTALDKLDSRSKSILKRRFGFVAYNQDEAENGVTLGTLGDEYGVSKERVRQIEAKALETLKKILSKDRALLRI